MTPQPIHTPTAEPMKVACFMSGSGTNTVKIIEASMKTRAYRVTLIFTDVKDTRRKKNGEKMSRALDIAEKYGISYECRDIRDFYKKHGRKRSDLTLRPEFDMQVLEAIRGYDIDIIANAGYMSIVSQPLLDAYDGRIVNVHPADLTIKQNGHRKYTGIHVVRDAILAGETQLRSTTHIVRAEVDGGEVLAVSQPVQVQLPAPLDKVEADKKLLEKVVDEHQDRLKENGDWVVYPYTLRLIAEGRLALNNDGVVYLDGEPRESGVTLGDD